jgi:hypothetical protein
MFLAADTRPVDTRMSLRRASTSAPRSALLRLSTLVASSITFFSSPT